MQLKIIQNSHDFFELETEWNDLLTCCSASHVPFLRHEYLTTWWSTLGGGEWKHAELFIVTARQEDDSLIGVAPLFLTNDREGEPSLLLLGSIEISDYLDLIVRPQDLQTFVEELLDLLAGEQAPEWETLDLYNLPEDSPTLAALEAAAEKRSWTYDQQRLQPCPYIPLPGDWEDYLASIKKKQRHEIRRKMRRAENHTQSIRWYIVQDESTLDTEIDDFLSLMAQDPEKDKFLTDVMHTQMRASLHAIFRAGWLQLAFLEVGGHKAAGYLNFDFADHIWVYNSGIDFEYRDLSPGWVLLGYLLRWANENKRIALDFMRGDEAYKYRFGAVVRYVVRSTIKRR
jgi:CelD/BcsL family acetyltransferase involved in cellulose biosynthesis